MIIMAYLSVIMVHNWYFFV